ncbi:hypothetical protein NGI46_08000 [Peribacillus butanolivorans]|uniref:hypothetical protein n=1 Tax=Peribacillus butanolivorans TaxID=421767 RepID=UPI00207C2F34|nr:hypothetical protein [Peribacillus butanolivorans]MCO0597409.1 hypothetical protein [Peribacillus butanolivorans]
MKEESEAKSVRRRDIKGMGENDQYKRHLKKVNVSLKHLGKSNPELEKKLRNWLGVFD